MIDPDITPIIMIDPDILQVIAGVSIVVGLAIGIVAHVFKV